MHTAIPCTGNTADQAVSTVHLQLGAAKHLTRPLTLTHNIVHIPGRSAQRIAMDNLTHSQPLRQTIKTPTRYNQLMRLILRPSKHFPAFFFLSKLSKDNTFMTGNRKPYMNRNFYINFPYKFLYSP